MQKTKRNPLLAAFITLALYIVASVLSRQYAPEIRSLLLGTTPWGELVYILAVVVSIVVAPVELLPLLPVAVNLWGPAAAAAYTILGYTSGALIAFALARAYGFRVVRRLTGKSDLKEWRIGATRSVFWIVVLARITLPVDLVSYAAGLFTKIKWPLYLAATVIGVTPFALVFSYGAKLSLGVQLGIMAVAVLIVASKHKEIKKGLSNILRPS